MTVFHIHVVEHDGEVREILPRGYFNLTNFDRGIDVLVRLGHKLLNDAVFEEEDGDEASDYDDQDCRQNNQGYFFESFQSERS